MRRLTVDPGYDGTATFSPDGLRVAYMPDGDYYGSEGSTPLTAGEKTTPERVRAATYVEPSQIAGVPCDHLALRGDVGQSPEAIALSFLRSGLGLQSTPANLVLISLSLFMTFYVMAPTFDRAWQGGGASPQAKKITERGGQPHRIEQPSGGRGDVAGECSRC